MPTVEKTAGGRVNVRGVGEFTPGDRAEVDADQAAYLCEERGDFEIVDDVEKTDDSAEPDGESEDSDAGADETFAFDPGDATDFETNGWLDNDYGDRADAVLAGGLDDYLDEIEEAETSQTVIDAVDERRAELEG
jgi:hypothetical protein